MLWSYTWYLVFCDRFFKKCTSYSISSSYSLFRCLLGGREWTWKGAGWKPVCAQLWLKMFVFFCMSLHVPLCCVYFERTVAWSKWYFFQAVPLWRWVASGKHGVFYAFVLWLRAGLIPGSWLSFFTLVTSQCGVSSFHRLFFPVCVFIRFSYAEKVFNNLILQIVIILLSHWSLILIAHPGKGLL